MRRSFSFLRTPTHRPATVLAHRTTALTLTLGMALAGVPAAPAAATGVGPPSEDCQIGTTALADQVMAGHLTLGTFAAVTLPADPTWREAPFHGDRNWLFNYHSMRWVLPLLKAGELTGRVAYTNRAAFLLRDWLTTNPRSAPANPMAWNDHATAWRASVLACAVDALGTPAWLLAGLNSHGRALADPTFYVKHGNHALNQDIGLLDVACRVGNGTWRSLAASRLATLVDESVDAQGVTNEQSIGYQLYNYLNYERGRRHLTTCGAAIPAGLTRVELMPDFLAYGTAPDGNYEQIGDTGLDAARPIAGTTAEFAATGGASGPRPATTIKRYTAGFLFARSGWGDARPFDQETFWTLRFGPGLFSHGHADGGSLTLAAHGRRLLVDSGKFSYTAGPWRTWFVGRTAHNVVSVDGLTYNAHRATTLATRTGASYLLATTSNTGYTGVTDKRRVVWSRAADYLIVQDVLAARVTRTFRQTWHLGPGSAPLLMGNRLDTRQPGANLAILELAGHPTNRVVTGRTKPIQGWVSYTYGTKRAAPVLESAIRGRSARYLTLLVPYTGAKPAIGGHVVHLAADGFVVDVTIGTYKERVTVSPSSTSIAVLHP
jgi:hypothetical protein